MKNTKIVHIFYEKKVKIISRKNYSEFFWSHDNLTTSLLNSQSQSCASTFEIRSRHLTCLSLSEPLTSIR